jgi:hypothetical protein
LFAALVFFSHGAYAEEQYQTVVSGLYNRHDGDQNSRTISYGLQGRAYFTPVKTDGHPYGEAAFLERIGSVYGFAEKGEFSEPGREGDGPLFGIGINAAKPGVPLAVEVFYNRSTREYDPPSTPEVTNDTYGTKAGYFFTDTGIAGFQYLYSAWDNESTGFPHTILRQLQYGFFTKYDHDRGQNRLLSIQATLTKHESRKFAETLRNTEESVLIDYYFTRSLSAGVGFRNASGTEADWEGKTYSANVQYYLTRLISINAGFARFLNANAGKENSRSCNTGVAARF